MIFVDSKVLGQEARRFDSAEGIGRVKSETKTENNAGAIIEGAVAESLKQMHSTFLNCFSIAFAPGSRPLAS